MDVYLISSRTELLEKARGIFQGERFFFLEKPNRGRDVSAFCVTCRGLALNYEFFSFVHDKKEKNAFTKGQVSEWVENLWGNTIGNGIYIENVVSYLALHEKVGLLSPMEPIVPFTDNRFWGEENYANILDLAKKLNLTKTEIDVKKPPIAVGTCFWARTKALEKLLRYEWQYEDFPEEPLPDDGTISHAIERIFPYVSQDAGFRTQTVMTKQFAAKMLGELYHDWMECGTYLRSHFGVRESSELDGMDEEIDAIKSFCAGHKKNYIYGAGRFAQDLLILCGHLGIQIAGCLVTNLSSGKREVRGIEIYEFGKINLNGCGVLVALNRNVQTEVVETLRMAGIEEVYRFRA